MKNKASKRLLSVVLSVLMVVTSVPLGAFVAQARTDWTLVSSTDFTDTSWEAADAGVTSVRGHYYTNAGTGFKSADGSNSYMTWGGFTWANNVNEGTITSSTDGALVPDGYIYLNGWYDDGVAVGSSTPITGAESFKIDVAFSFSKDYTPSGKNNNCFIRLLADTTNYRDESDMWINKWFSQSGYGSLYTYDNGTADAVTRNNDDYFKIGTGNPNLYVNTLYHYIAEYSHGIMHTYILDDDGYVCTNFGAASISTPTSQITGINLGYNSTYYQGLTYQSVKLYTGVADTSSAEKDLNTAKDKYLFAYFTGNSDAGEQLRYAVSDDGYNWESLNGGARVTKDLQADIAADKNAYAIYPTGTRETTDATGNVRDPYILEAEDGSYYILATDLDTDTNGFSANSKMFVWHLDDPSDIDSVDPWYIDITSMCENINGEGVGITRAWAPEAIWDSEKNAYMLFFGMANSNWDTGTRMVYVYTRDFKSFLTEPEFLLPHIGEDNIDGNITYYNGLYYLWFKDETDSRIGYTTAEHANGPYGEKVAFVPDEYSNVFEGPEIFRLNSNGEYVLIADHFNAISFVAAYNQTKPFDYHNGVYGQLYPNTSMNINHLKPRHGSVCRITTAQYENLIKKYGRNVWDVSNIENGKQASDYLVARYFTTDDSSFNAVSKNYKLTTSNLNMGEYGGKQAANFTGSTSSKAYAYVDTTDMLSGANAKDGVTFDFYAYVQSASTSRFFDWSSCGVGECVWDSSTHNQNNTSYVFVDSNLQAGVNNTHWGYRNEIQFNDQKTTDKAGAWHRYTVSVQNGWLTYYIDGSLVKYDYASDGNSYTKVGTPIDINNINDGLFADLNNLIIGASAWGADNESVMLNAYISDFRVYNRALTYTDIEDSDSQLEENTGTELDNSAILMYDPAEDMAADDTYAYDGIAKHVYTNSVDDDVYGKVLNIAGGVTTHNGTVENAAYVDATGTDADDGYTISFWYNPKTIEEGAQAIFNIGEDHTNWGSRRYLELQENGTVQYVWDVNSAGDNYFEITNAFGTSGLTADEWQHIVIQIVPNGLYDKLVFYVDGVQTKSFAISTDSNNPKLQGYSVRNYLQAATRGVYFGNSCGYWSNSASGNLDEFKIYTGVIDPESILTQDNERIADTLIARGIKGYEEKMAALVYQDPDTLEFHSNGYVYTNMYPAYLAYDEVCRYRDACEIGNIEKNAKKIVALYNQLKDATDAMQIYKKPATVTALTKNDTGFTTISTASGTIPVNNMLNSAFNLSTAAEPYEGSNSKTNSAAAVSSSDVVWLYTGLPDDTPTAPVACYIYKSGNGNRGAHAVYMISQAAYNGADKSNSTERAGRLAAASDIQLVDYWRMTSTKSENMEVRAMSVFIYPDSNYNWLGYLASQASNGDDGDTTYNYSYYPDNGERNPGGNYIKFLCDSSSFSNYFSSEKYLYESNQYFGINLKGSNGTVWTYWRSTNTAVAGKSIKVVDYSQAYSTMTDDRRAYILSSITAFNPASCAEFVKAYDDLTNIDYVGTINNSVDNAASLASTVKEKVDALKGIDIQDEAILDEWKKASDSALANEVAADSDQTLFYNALVENDGAVLENTAAEGETANYQPVGNGEVYTSSSVAAYENSYNAIKEYYTSLDPAVAGINDGAEANRNQEYATNTSLVDGLLTQVEGAREMLNIAADYSPAEDVTDISSATYNTYANNNGTDLATQEYTLDSWLDYKQAYEEAKAWADKDEAYKLDTEKYSTTYVATKDGLSYGPYLSYDAEGNLTSTNIDHYSYYGGDYYTLENGSYVLSRFEEGNYILVDGNYVDVSSMRWYPDTIDTQALSLRQQSINTTSQTAVVKNGLLSNYAVDAEESYQSYNIAQGYTFAVDQTAYAQGTIDNLHAYGYVLESGRSYAPSYTQGGTNDYVYTTYQGRIYKNKTYADTDTKTALILNTLNINPNSQEQGGTDNLKEFKVTFNYVVDGVTSVQFTNSVYKYGQTVNLSYNELGSGYAAEGRVISWTITQNGSTTVKNVSTDSYVLSVVSDCVVNVYVQTPSAANINVSISDYFGRTQSVTVANATTVTASGLTLNFSDGQSVTVAGSPYMDFSGWTVNGEALTSGYAITANVTIKANGVKNADTTTYTVTGGKFDDGSTTAVYKADDIIRITADDENCIGIAVATDDGYELVTYASTYDIYAFPTSAYGQIDFVVVTDENVAETIGTDYDLGVFSVMTYKDNYVNAYTLATVGTLPQGVTVTERGVLLTRGDSTPEGFVKGSSGSKAYPSTTAFDNPQYLVNMKCTNTAGVYARAYISYTKNVTINGSSYNLPLVAYGNIVNVSNIAG